MATSGTTTFNLSFDRIIERAYARCGKSLRTGYELQAARDNLNLLFSEWGKPRYSFMESKKSYTKSNSQALQHILPLVMLQMFLN